MYVCPQDRADHEAANTPSPISFLIILYIKTHNIESYGLYIRIATYSYVLNFAPTSAHMCIILEIETTKISLFIHNYS